MEQKLYDFLCSKGDKAQELFVQYMTKVLGHKFLAGDRNGKTVNPDLIEEITRASYIPPNTLGYKHGSRLVFSQSKKNDGYIMPDELFLMKFGDSEHNFYDVKNRTKDTLTEKFEKIIHYSRIEYFSGVKTYVAVIIWNYKNKGYDIYIKNASEIWKENRHLTPKDRVEFDLDYFIKINEESIKP